MQWILQIKKRNPNHELKSRYAYDIYKEIRHDWQSYDYVDYCSEYKNLDELKNQVKHLEIETTMEEHKSTSNRFRMKNKYFILYSDFKENLNILSHNELWVFLYLGMMAYRFRGIAFIYVEKIKLHTKMSEKVAIRCLDRLCSLGLISDISESDDTNGYNDDEWDEGDSKIVDLCDSGTSTSFFK